jgi:hypothetical protein
MGTISRQSELINIEDENISQFIAKEDELNINQ